MLASLSTFCRFLTYLTAQSGKNVLATILEVWPLVRVADGRKYGRFWSSQGSAGAEQG